MPVHPMKNPNIAGFDRSGNGRQPPIFDPVESPDVSEFSEGLW